MVHQSLAQRPSTTATAVALQIFGQERLGILKSQICKDLSDAELDIFALVCQRTKLDPFSRPPQIYAIKRGGQLTIQGGVDSFRLVAARTREYAGQAGPYWCGPDGDWKDLWLADTPPAAARVGVWRKGFKEPIWSVATWKESAQYFKGQLGDFWQRMPALMLAKCAEVNALKRAFPNDTEGVELALIEEELRREAPARSQRYAEIFGTDEDRDRDGVPMRVLHDGRTIDTESGEVLAEVDDRDAKFRCTSCGTVVKDQSGQTINDNQRELLLQRFGSVTCRDCRNL